MALKTYTGSCHCGAIRYEADMDLGKGTLRCNCSYCSKARAWFAFVPSVNVRVVSGKTTLADYQWTPPGKPHPHLHFHFCKTCGVRAFARGNAPSLGGPFYAIAVSTLDNADPDELAASIRYIDGKHDAYDRAPEDTRLM